MFARREAANDGFMLTEGLVALAIVALALAVIGQLGFASLAAARRAESRLALTAAARTALASLASRNAGSAHGRWERGEWRIDALPFGEVAPGGPVVSGWTPERLRLAVTDAAGGTLTVETVRLRRLAPP